MKYRLFCVLLLLVPVLLHAETAGHRPMALGVLGLVQAVDGGDPSLTDVVQKALWVQLQRRRVRFATADPGPGQSAWPAEALRLAAERNARYLLVSRYSATASVFALTVALYDAEADSCIRTTSASGRINLRMDLVVDDVVSQALSGIVFPPDSGDQAEPAPAEPGPGEPAPLPEESRFVLSAAAAPFVPLGGTGSYAKVGALGTVYAAARVSSGSVRTTVGVLAGGGFIQAAGVASDATLVFVPLGPQIVLSMHEGSFPGVLLHLSAGPALLDTITSWDGSLVKVIPYALGGISLRLPFTRSIGASVDLAFAAFLESPSLTIFAFTPQVVFDARL